MIVAATARGARVGDRHTNAHAPLLVQLSDLVDQLLKATAAHEWPTVELHRLVSFLRSDVMRQIAREELVLLRSRGASSTVAQLGRDHARLCAVTEVLERAAAGEGSGSIEELEATARSLVIQLERHIRVERELLGALEPR
ncbi:MAG: hemerythrin domain-containing protein [Acidothermaceae bacterium]